VIADKKAHDSRPKVVTFIGDFTSKCPHILIKYGKSFDNCMQTAEQLSKSRVGEGDEEFGEIEDFKFEN
jgi:hypothetical protein